MKILSIDVGIKNLAFCMLNYKNDSISIEKWNSINICEDQERLCKEKKRKIKTFV